MSSSRLHASAFLTCAAALLAGCAPSGSPATMGNPVTGEGLPNPNPTVTTNWGDLPEGREWGTTAGIDIDPIDGHVWAYERCAAGTASGGSVNCETNPVDPIFKFDRNTGEVLANFGADLFVTPHGIHVDSDGNVWVTDFAGNEAGTRGHQVFKFSKDGRVLMTLGTAGVAGDGPDTFNGPADVAIAPNGDIFVADGHGNSRVVKFSGDGEFIMAWGSEGTGPGQFNEPHSLAFDSRGRLFVGDRVNQRIQVFDQQGNFLDEWTEIMASGMHITADDVIYVADYQLREGIVIANAGDFSPIGFISEALGEGVTVDASGNVFVGEVIRRNLKKFIRNER